MLGVEVSHIRDNLALLTKLRVQVIEYGGAHL